MTVDRPELSNPEGYRQKMIGLAAGRDPIEVMSETADVLSRLASEHSKEVLATRPFPGKWTPLEVIGHLVDTEWVHGYRLRTILCDNRPVMIGMDQELWAAKLEHNFREPAELVEEFRQLREMNLRIWRRLTPADLDREGLHQERGPESLRTIFSMIPGHDRNHILQIEKYLRAIADQAKPPS